MAVAAFTGEVKFAAPGRLPPVENYPLFHQPVDRVRAVAHHEFHDVPVAEPDAGFERVLDVRLDRVVLVQHGRHAALGPIGRALGEFPFAEHRDAGRFRQVKCQREASGTAAEYQHVVFESSGHGTPTFPGFSQIRGGTAAHRSVFDLPCGLQGPWSSRRCLHGMPATRREGPLQSIDRSNARSHPGCVAGNCHGVVQKSSKIGYVSESPEDDPVSINEKKIAAGRFSTDNAKFLSGNRNFFHHAPSIRAKQGGSLDCGRHR